MLDPADVIKTAIHSAFVKHPMEDDPDFSPSWIKPNECAHLAEVILQMRNENVRPILVEPYQSRKTAQTVAAETGATVVDVSQFPGGVKGTESGYIELIDYDVNAVAKALGDKAESAALK